MKPKSMVVRAKVVPTGRTHPGGAHLGEPAAEYRLTGPLPPSSGYFADGDVVQLDDDSYAYACQAPTDGAIGLYRDVVAVDYGGNEIRRRKAPTSTFGILAPPRGLALQGIFGRELVGWLS